jgi:hypothetical protein
VLEISLNFNKIGGVVEIIVVADHREQTETDQIVIAGAPPDGIELDAGLEFIQRQVSLVHAHCVYSLNIYNASDL